ncbi:hypothetical protein ABFV99_21350 [Cytobacillus horneckiae]|uniref:hypothetical protein n=1 Tax=Cytobacillus horneckiae TaxID=549687 RepID=UPI0034CD0223
MKKSKKIITTVLGLSIFFGVGLSSTSAAVPTDAYISSPNLSYTKTSSKTIDRKIGWGGGAGSTYRVTWNDGLSPYTFSANYYTTTLTSSYTLGSKSTYTWSNKLTVTNGSTDTASGSVKLTR